jgi:hypothetical protein
MKIHPVAAEFFCVDEWMDREDIMKQIAAFCTFSDLIILLYGTRTQQQTYMNQPGAGTLVTCTEFPGHSSSPSSSDWQTWQHTICPCICSPLLRCPRENADFVHHGITVNQKGINV